MITNPRVEFEIHIHKVKFKPKCDSSRKNEIVQVLECEYECEDP